VRADGGDIQREDALPAFGPAITMVPQFTNVVAPVQPSFIRQHPNFPGITGQQDWEMSWNAAIF
jgi:hypothetical protein